MTHPEPDLPAPAQAAAHRMPDAPASIARRLQLRCAGIAVLALVASATARPSWAWGFGDRVTGSGTLATETRAVSGYDAIELMGNFKVVVRGSRREGAEVRADDNLLSWIETRVVEGGSGRRVLQVRWREGARVRTKETPVVTVDVQTLRALILSGSGRIQVDGLKTPGLKIRLSGSGDVDVQQLQADECEVKLSGSGDVRLSGQGGQLAISVAGSGDVDAQQLEAASAAVEIAGSGDVKVNASQSLAVSIAGSGDVHYRGSARPQTSIAGSGRVKPL